MANGTILSSPLFVEIILPFLLVFVVMFAILQKSKVLGEGKKQIDALVSLVIGLIVISFGFATGIIVNLVPFLAVSAIVILIFLLLYGMVYHGEEFKIDPSLRIGLGIVVGIAVIIAVLVATGAWDFLREYFFFSESGSSVFVNGIFIVIIIGAVALALTSGKKGS